MTVLFYLPITAYQMYAKLIDKLSSIERENFETRGSHIVSGRLSGPSGCFEIPVPDNFL